VATFLQGLGLTAQASADHPAQMGGTMRLLCINGAETQYADTMALLEQSLGLTGTPSADPSAAIQTVTEPNEAVGFVVITGTDLNLTVPPA
jgi:hypothetical protein